MTPAGERPSWPNGTTKRFSAFLERRTLVPEPLSVFGEPDEIRPSYEIPPGVRPGEAIDLSLDRYGIRNLWIRAIIRTVG